MPRKSAGHSFEALGNYSEDYVANPLKAMRGEATQQDYARVLGCNAGVVAAAEEGMFALIPAVYRKRIKSLMEVNEQYQAHRTAKRIFYFDPMDFPDAPALRFPMQGLIEHFGWAPYKFGARSCVHHLELHKMKTDKRLITENFYTFLTDIGVDKDWIALFNEALRRTFPPKVQLPNAS